MPPIRKKKRTKVDRNFGEQEETESSESGKLSETNEVVKHLSRTRLDKENTPRRAKSWFAQRKEGDPYDADSEPEHGAIPLTAMTIDQNVPLDKQLFHSRLSPVHTDHSTPSIAPNCGYQTSDCYGFDNMPSPLPFSPVGQPVLPTSFVPSSPGSVSVTSSITSISPGKRKADPRIFDVPIERPSKKMKKKKTKLLDTEDEDWVYELKAEFQEVEMVDLVID